ncbi:hypothetical protein KW783_03220 [Candidatus Parcubacteria bacterium]|nr:hypothetical protein [Candidatus Parcubacteria bacterium]
MNIDTQHFKEKLEKEKKLLEKELSSVGRVNPQNKNDWEAKSEDLDILRADSNEVADNLEEFGENSAILGQLEGKLNDVKDALKRIENGTYGVCEIGKEQIEHDRLEANPSARTCLKHMS